MRLHEARILLPFESPMAFRKLGNFGRELDDRPIVLRVVELGPDAFVGPSLLALLIYESSFGLASSVHPASS